MLKVSAIASEIAQSEIRVMSVECERLRGINLAQGVCDTPAPEVVRQAAKDAIDQGLNTYTRLDGIAPLRQAIARKLAEYNHINVSPENEVLVASGATGAFYAASMALLNPGDEVIVFEPYYGYHVHTLATMNIVAKPVSLAAPDFHLDLDAVKHAITPRTRAMIINTPGNPSGKIFSRKELEQLCELAMRHDLFIFTDEIYEYFLYDGNEHISPASLPGMAERTITISGFSKTFSVTGWRLGYLACAARWMQPIGYFHDMLYVCAPQPFQHGVLAGLNKLGPDFYRGLSEEYVVKRDRFCNALRESGLTPVVPAGAYYVLADVSSLPGKTAKAKAMYLLENTGVAAVAGSAFFHDGAGDHLLRFCYAKTDADLDAACERLLRLRTAAGANA